MEGELKGRGEVRYISRVVRIPRVIRLHLLVATCRWETPAGRYLAVASALFSTVVSVVTDYDPEAFRAQRLIEVV